MSNYLRCHICQTIAPDVEVWVMGPYSLNACATCGEQSPQLADSQGNRMERLRDVEQRQFSEGIADIVKELDQ